MSQRIWSPGIVEIGDRIAALSAGQAAQLNDFLTTHYGVEPVCVPDTLVPPEPDVLVLDEVGEPAYADVLLTGLEYGRRIPVIKALREMFGLGLKEVKELVDSAPRTIQGRMLRSEAEQVQARLEAAGANVTLQPSVS